MIVLQVDTGDYQNRLQKQKSKGLITLLAPISQNGQTHSNNSSATADGLFDYVWPFCKVGA